MQAIWGHIWKHTVEKNLTSAINVTLQLPMSVLWGHILKHTAEKSRTNTTNVTRNSLRQAIWGVIWKPTVEKRKTNVTSVILRALTKVVWGHIWSGEKLHICKQCNYATSATHVTMQLPMFALRGDIWKYMVEKCRTNAINVTLHPFRQAIWGHI